MIYGNGTVNNIKNTWRDEGKGVLDDLGCHLIDLDIFLLNNNYKNSKYEIVTANNFESKKIDYGFFTRNNGRNQFICTTLMWKNTFKIDIIGSKGSLHLNGLNKWGKNTMTLRKRVYPSGVPEEEIYTFEGADESWFYDIEFFEKQIKNKITSCESDLFISKCINSF